MARKMAQLRILSLSSARFRNREEAGKLLAGELNEYREQNAVVLGIPRGGIAVAREIARPLDADLDIVLAHKLVTPGHEELAMGSVSEDGTIFLDQRLVHEFNIGETYIQQEKARQLAEMKRRTEIIRHVWPKIPLAGRIVIITDDGVATGATIQAALWAVKLEHPKKMIAAIPVGPEDTIRKLAEDVDEMVCLRVPPLFEAVGQFYEQFQSVEDEEVLRILRDGRTC